jgi:hypothetical protein
MIRLISVWRGEAVWMDYEYLCDALGTYEDLLWLHQHMGNRQPSVFLVYAESGVDVVN